MKRQLEEPTDSERSLSRDEIEQFYAGLARAELNQDPNCTKLQWWSEVAPGELRFQCSFKRPSVETVDEVVRRLSGDSLADDQDSVPSLEATVHRISVDMEDRFGRRPSMEELAAGIAIVSGNNGMSPAQRWREQRLEMLEEFSHAEPNNPWERSFKRILHRTVIPASATEEDDGNGSPRRRSLGKDSNESADLEWLRASSTAAIEALRSSQSWCARSSDLEGASWSLGGQFHSARLNTTSQRTRIRAQFDPDVN
eukprot:TRINITY_DN12565_c0_g1_i3.p1 TRINITY_DN12565_c0_g1~~TRINITY_DN12565_c0_g1_i3.p1  ORF type:complete len:255 (+),score=15.53 TRINITY_DN12565_c0_g1_i3:224-988(+)